MEQPTSCPGAERVEPPEERGLPVEEGLLRSLEDPDVGAVSAVVEGICRAVKARFAIVVRKEGNSRCQLVGRWGNGRAIGRPDKLARVEDLLCLTEAKRAVWRPLESAAGVFRAALPVTTTGDSWAALIIEGRGAGPQDTPFGTARQARRLSVLVAAAIAADDLKARDRPASQPSCPAGTPSDTPAGTHPLLRGCLEYTLAGSPREESFAHVLEQFPEIIGQSPAIAGVLQSVLTGARSEIPVLIEGESGTGKELVARAIHRVSPRGESPFICENCGALPESLIETELFGHEKGAFTGAERQRSGLFERAHGGTVFLDEVGELDLSMQRKLLRVLQEKEIRRVGGQDTVSIDFRLVSATNRVLEQMVAAGRFREDLFYRLNVLTIAMPALRERAGDVPLLVDHFNRLFSAEIERPKLEFTERAMEVLTVYRWPGNIRELRNEVWSLASTDRSSVDAEHLSRRILRAVAGGSQQAASAAKPLHEVEREVLGAVILEALRRANGNRAEAARKLGITRSSLYRKMQRYGLV